MKKLFYIFTLLLLGIVVKAQQSKEPPLTRILFVFDASQSMLANWESDTKMNIAKRFFTEMLDSLAKIDNLELALRVYGHQKPVPPQDCSDTKLEVGFTKNNIEAIKQKMRNITPKGTTPIARSLENAALDFPYCPSCRNIIILITDGIEACDGDPCAVSLALQKQGVILKPFVIGVGLDLEFKKTFECIGNYYDATSESQFKQILGIVISQALNNTTLQINLLDTYGNPTETDVNMTLYDVVSGKMRHNFIHTINNRGVPDTVVVDPFVTYRAQIHTIPPVFIDTIKLTPGKHTVVAVDAPQGYLVVKSNSVHFKDMRLIVRNDSISPTLNTQYVNQVEKYITGNYQVEILTMPRLVVDKVNVKQSHTTTLQIPDPGMATISSDISGYGSVYVDKDNKLEWVYNLNTQINRETLVLLPGNYKVVFRAKNIKKTIATVEKNFKITSGCSIQVQLK
ncbi:MAG: von willebrand factor type a [Bacteroidetes bacterium HGW-Bacteroidetes-21]|jgi:Ca-activated chloride channel family protein|nr:MAG: von willebrand factor type a [Bacteroidetes bacterium HGW-Bacteroidetes-21]